MAAAAASPGGAICLNCEVFGWPQGEGGGRMHCSRCSSIPTSIYHPKAESTFEHTTYT